MTITADPDKTKSRTKPKQEQSFFPGASADDPKKRQGNHIEDFNDIDQEETAVQVQEEQKANPYNKAFDILSYQAPKPTYDKNRPEELKRLARNNAIAKGLNLVGDTISLGTGANVNRREYDGAEEGYTKKMYDYIDDYNKRLDDWNWRDFAHQIRTGQLMLNQANADRNYGMQRDKMEQDQENFDANMNLNTGKLFQSAKHQDAMDGERKRHNQQSELLRWLELQRRQARDNHYFKFGNSSKEPFKIYDNSGGKIELEGSEREKLLTMILTDAQVGQEDLDLLKPKLGQPVSTNSINLLVQKYWHQSPATIDYLSKRYPDLISGQQEESFSIPNEWRSSPDDTQVPLRPGEQAGEPPQSNQTKNEPGDIYDDLNFN